MTEIDLGIGTKGIIVHAVPKNSRIHSEWLVLIANITDARYRGERTFHIQSHISYDLGLKNIYFNNGRYGNWGYGNDFDFYVPTDDEKEFMIRQLANRGYKFIPILNKLVKKR